jgi:hypothetical protein
MSVIDIHLKERRKGPMNRQKGKPSDVSKAPTSSLVGELGVLSESHQMTLHRYLTVEGDEGKNFSTNPIEYHLTIRLTHETLSRRELSLLLEVIEYQIVRWGISMPMYLCLQDLYFRLLGNKRHAKEIRESKIRLTLTVAEIIIHSLMGVELSLDPSLVTELRPKVRELLSPHLMSSRTYGSRYKTWRPEKFFVVRIVPVDIHFLERRKGSDPYSGYCKGYGESHPSTHSKKTKPSPELDGDGTSYLTSDEEFLFIRCTEPVHVLCEFLLIKYKTETGKDL